MEKGSKPRADFRYQSILESLKSTIQEAYWLDFKDIIFTNQSQPVGFVSRPASSQGIKKIDCSYMLMDLDAFKSNPVSFLNC